MNNESTTKTCKMCCMEIPKAARKCPHCLHFQTRLAMITFHPGFFILLAFIPVIGLGVVTDSIFDKGKDYETFKDQISITESHIAFGEMKTGETVVVMGAIKNTSSIPWKDIQFHIDFMDAQGKQADVGEKEDYSFYLPANESSSFKISFKREFPEGNYVSAKVRVMTAKDARARW